jgi:integrase
MTVSRGDTVEFEVKGRGKLTGTVASAYMALGNSPRVTVISGDKKYTRLAASVTLTRKAAEVPGVKAGFGRRSAGEPSPTRGRRYAAELLTPAEVAAILDTCSRRAPTGIRNRAMLTLLYRSGLRISELLALRLSDVNLDAHTIRLLDTKSGKSQTRGFHPSATDALARWADKRRQLGIRNGRLFCTLDGGPVSAEYVRMMLRRAAAKAGIEKRVHPHGLRHTFAAELEAAGTPVTTISKLLGHSSVAVTNTYLQHLTNSEAVTALEGVDLPPLPGAKAPEPATLEDEVAALREQVKALAATASAQAAKPEAR